MRGMLARGQYALSQPVTPLVLLVLLVGAILVLGPASETDSYWHVLIGRDILEYGRLTGPTTTTYGPHLPGWETTQPASEILMWLAYNTFGWSGLVAIRAIGELVMLTTVAIIAYYFTPNRWRAWMAPILAATIGLATVVQERPQLVSLILLPVIGGWVYRGAVTGRWPNAILILGLLSAWGWFHGAVLLASVLITGVVIGRALIQLLARSRGWPPLPTPTVSLSRNPWLIAVLAMLATVLNPQGPYLWVRFVDISRAGTGNLEEWAAPGLAGMTYPLIVWVLVILAWRARYRALGIVPIRLILIDLLILVPMTVYAVTTVRAIFMFGLVLVPLAARRAGQVFTPVLPVWVEGARARGLVRVVSVVLGGVILLVTSVNIGRAGLPALEQPSARILSGIASTTGERRVFGETEAVGLIQLTTRPGVMTPADGRADRYGAEIVSAMYAANGGAVDVLEGYWPMTTDVVTLAGGRLAQALQAEGWRVACEDAGRVWLVSPGMSGECGPDTYPEPYRS